HWSDPLYVTQPVLWTPTGAGSAAMTVLPTLGGTEGFATRITDGGTVLGAASNPEEAFRPVTWQTVGGIQPPQALYDGPGIPTGINSTGEIVGGSWTPSPLPLTFSVAYGPSFVWR